MPLHEYQCEACGHRFEAIQKFSDPPKDTCPNCGKGPVRKLISAPAFHLKGTGWYVTDYAKKDSDSKKDPGKESGKESGKEGSTSKPEAAAKTEKTDKPAAGSESASTSSSTPQPSSPSSKLSE